VSNEPIPETANVINADLVPRIRKFVEKKYPSAKFTDSDLDTLLCYATVPEDFKMPDAGDVIRAFKSNQIQSVDDGLSLLPDAGLISVHQLMQRHPQATIAVLAQFQKEDDKLQRDSLRRAIRRENCEGMNKNELVEYLLNTNQIEPSQKATARKRINEIRKEDSRRLSERQLKDYHIETP
jgi:hypothetical protein